MKTGTAANNHLCVKTLFSFGILVHENGFASGGSDGSIMFWNVGSEKEVGVVEQVIETLIALPPVVNFLKIAPCDQLFDYFFW